MNLHSLCKTTSNKIISSKHFIFWPECPDWNTPQEYVCSLPLFYLILRKRFTQNVELGVTAVLKRNKIIPLVF